MSLIRDITTLLQIADLSQEEINQLYNNINKKENERNSIKKQILKTREFNKNELIRLSQEIKSLNKNVENKKKELEKTDDKAYGFSFLGLSLVVASGVTCLINIIAMLCILAVSGALIFTGGVFAIKGHSQNKKIKELENKLRELQEKRIILIEEANNIEISKSETNVINYSRTVDNVMNSDFKEDKFYVIEGGKSL